MDANEIIKEMNKNLETSVKKGTLTLEGLDDLTFNSLEKIKEIINKNVKDTIANVQEEVKKKPALNAKK